MSDSMLPEGEAVELANEKLREEMLRYNLITDTNDRYDLAMALMEPERKVIVPTYPDPIDPDGMPTFGTMYKHKKGIELYVYTSVTLIPESCDAPDVMFYPLTDLVASLMADGEVSILRIDPGTEHGVGMLFENGRPSLFRLKRVEDHLEGQKP